MADSDLVALPNKRQKIAHDDDKPIVDLEKVVLMRNGSSVGQVPFLNFQTHAPNMISDLKTEIAEGETHRWKFYIYDVSGLIFTGSGIMRARWLTHRDLRAVNNNRLALSGSIASALTDAHRMGDVDFRDVLIDAWMLDLQSGQSAGNLDAALLQKSSSLDSLWTGRLQNLECALILHHDAGTVTMEENEDLHKSPYNEATCRRVRDLALTSFARPDRKPKDPLQLSNDEFCYNCQICRRTCVAKTPCTSSILEVWHYPKMKLALLHPPAAQSS